METVELRVHGVHGTSPGTMLGLTDGEVGQVAGDKVTGIYRARPGVKLPLRRLDDQPVSVEAYSWAALTSGIQGLLGWVRRALWLLLLPFALANLAYWARIELGRDNGQSRWGARAVRLSGLALTVFMVLTPCVIAIDLFAWQCYRGGVPGCSRAPGWADFMAAWTPAQRIGAATTVPMLVVLVLWLLSRRTLSRYEAVEDPTQDEFRGDERLVLTHPKLWNGVERTRRLQRLHVTGAVATVTTFSGAHVLHATEGGRGLVLATTVAGITAMVVALLLLTVSHRDDLETVPPGDGRLERIGAAVGDRVRALDDSFYQRLALTTITVYLVHVLALWRLGSPLDEKLDFYGHNLWFIGVFVLLTALHLIVFAGGRMQARYAIGAVVAPLVIGVTILTVLFDRDQLHGWVLGWALLGALAFWAGLVVWHFRFSARHHRELAWYGAGGSVFLAAAAWVALLFTTSAVVAAANWLNGDQNGVSGLVSTIETKQGGADAATPFDVDVLRSPAYVAAGEVVLRGAHVTPADASGTVAVSSGTVEVEGLSLEVPAEQAFTEGLGRTRVTKASSLAIEGVRVRLADSCLGPGSGKCTAEDADFHASGVLQVPSGSLRLVPGSGHVLLSPEQQPEYPLVVPQVLIWTPIAQLFWVVAVAVGLGLAVTRFFLRTAPQLRDRTFDTDPWVSPRDRKACLQARISAALAHRAETLLDVVGSITAPIALVTIVLSMTGEPPWSLPHAEWTRHIATAAMYLVVGMSGALVLLGSQFRRSESARKAAGVIWDLATFWPRAAHPLAPPCYAERVIPELTIRTRWALDQAPDNQVILSGHSQGSLIVAAMASRLSLRELQRVRIITYGSQIRALYGRVFPRVFGPEAIGYTPTTDRTRLDDPFPDLPRTSPPTSGPPADAPLPSDRSLRGRLTRAGGAWVNLVRRTDYLGYRVFSDLDSSIDLPVPEVPVESVGDPGPVVMTHSGYQHSLVYRTHIALWTGEEVVPDPSGTTGVPLLPPV